MPYFQSFNLYTRVKDLEAVHEALNGAMFVVEDDRPDLVGPLREVQDEVEKEYRKFREAYDGLSLWQRIQVHRERVI